MSKTYQTRLKIIDAYIDLVRFKDFDSITVKSIADKAQITRGTFYLYFSDIYEMVTYIEDKLLANMPNTPVSRQFSVDKLSFPSYEMCQDNAWERKWFEYYYENYIYFNTLLGPHGDLSFSVKIKKIIQNALKIMMQQDGMNDDDYQKYFMELVPNLYLSLAREWTTTAIEEHLDIDAVVEIVSTMRIGSMYRNSLNAQRAVRQKLNEADKEK